MSQAENKPIQTIASGTTAHAVLSTLMYFDLFRHPLTIDEIQHYCQWRAITLSETAIAIEELSAGNLIQHKDEFYFLSGSEGFINLRRERNDRAAHYSSKAVKWSKFISGFPFVRTVCISGSLSKGTMDRDGDIDYFIITEPGRLWIARTFLILFKKMFLFNSKKYFCVNYFIDTDHLTVPDHNIFTATEIVFVKAMRDNNWFGKFRESNRWVKHFYPNTESANESIPVTTNGTLKRIAEKLLNGTAGEWIDEKFMRITLNRWNKKFPDRNPSEFEVDFRSRRSVSKHHPQGFQRIVLKKLEARRTELEKLHNIRIDARIMEWSA
jgi:hypothetical protein